MNNYSYRRKRNKHGNQRSVSEKYEELNGYRFDSKLERDRAEELVLLMRAGELSDLQFQVTIYMTRSRIGYKADFKYIENYRGGSRIIYEDAKGFEGVKWNIIKRLWPEYGPGWLRITMRRGRGIATVKEIFGKGTDHE